MRHSCRRAVVILMLMAVMLVPVSTFANDPQIQPPLPNAASDPQIQPPFPQAASDPLIQPPFPNIATAASIGWQILRVFLFAA